MITTKQNPKNTSAKTQARPAQARHPFLHDRRPQGRRRGAERRDPQGRLRRRARRRRRRPELERRRRACRGRGGGRDAGGGRGAGAGAAEGREGRGRAEKVGRGVAGGQGEGGVRQRRRKEGGGGRVSEKNNLGNFPSLFSFFPLFISCRIEIFFCFLALLRDLELFRFPCPGSGAGGKRPETAAAAALRRFRLGAPINWLTTLMLLLSWSRTTLCPLLSTGRWTPLSASSIQTRRTQTVSEAD